MTRDVISSSFIIHHFMRPLSTSRYVNIEDLRRGARRRLPRAVFDYIDGGADRENTLDRNARAYNDIIFRPRCAVAVKNYALKTTVLGTEIAMPIILAPVGSSRMFYPRGEEVAAKVAGEFGTIYTLSTLSGCLLEDVKKATTGPAWYQLYLVGGHDVARGSIERARKAGYSAIVVTIDTPVAGMRERDVHNGTTELLTGGMLTKLPFLPDVFAHPGWLISFLLDGGVPRLQNVIVPGEDGQGMPMMDVGTFLRKSVVTWEDISWIRHSWRGPIVIKGILTADDARRAVDEGAAAISVSNHGGRQLDCVSATIAALPEIVSAVGGQTEILLDGGIRRGADIVKALCLGARAVLCGRAYAYGLAAAGQAGVARALDILREDVERTLRLLGCSSVRDLEPTYVRHPSNWLDPQA
jgi:isopentenyl diphosphate isomerase/L-lactate dehydrogenase-like FMN-dependent dehydrogenase